MAGSTFQPPIHLDPNQDPSQQTAFINQNFQSLAAVLESNSFRIVDTFPAVDFSVSGGSTGNTGTLATVTHNLGYTPLVMGALAITSSSPLNLNGVYLVPFFQFGNTLVGSVYVGTIVVGVSVNSVTTTQAFFNFVLQNGYSIGGTVTLYILQLTA